MTKFWVLMLCFLYFIDISNVSKRNILYQTCGIIMVPDQVCQIINTFRMPFWRHHWLDLQQFSSTFWLQPLPYGGAFQIDSSRKVLQKIVDFVG
jgi:hypothetical protein